MWYVYFLQKKYMKEILVLKIYPSEALITRIIYDYLFN